MERMVAAVRQAMLQEPQKYTHAQQAPCEREHQQAGESKSQPAAASPVPEDGILIEMGSNNDLCINATHLTVKCDNNFLVTDNGQRTQRTVSAQSNQATVSEQRSCVVVQQLDVSQTPAKRPKRKWAQGLAVVLAAKAAHCTFQWHWMRHRTERALARASVPCLMSMLASPNPRIAQAVLVHLIYDLQNASNLRLLDAATQPFPPCSDLQLSRSSAAANRVRLHTYDRISPSTQPKRPTSCLSISSVETTPSSDEQDACPDPQPVCDAQTSGVGVEANHAAARRVSVGASAGSAESGPTVYTAVPPPPKAAATDESIIEEAGTTADACTTQTHRQLLQQGAAHEVTSWPNRVPAGGRVLALLIEHPQLWDLFVALLKRLLCSKALKLQRDAAWAVQVASFSSEVLGYRLVHAGIVKLLLVTLTDSYGLRIRSGGPPCRLRQPGQSQPSLPGAKTVLSASPINIPTLYVDLRSRMLTLSPRGVNLGFLNMLPKLGRAAQRNLSPRCRNIAAKRQVAAEALQNLCALRTGARHLLATEHALDLLCSCLYTLTPIGQAAVAEACNSCMLHFPRCRSSVYNVGFDHALKYALEDARSGTAVEVFMRSVTMLSSDRSAHCERAHGGLTADTSESSMFV